MIKKTHQLGWLLVLLMSGALPAWADMRVSMHEGVPTVQVDAPALAVFQPKDNELWVVASPGRAPLLPEALTDGGHLSAAWRGEVLKVRGGGQGVRLIGAMPHRWQLSGSTGHWQLAVGGESATTAVATGQPTQAKPLTVTATNGASHQVLLATGPVAGINLSAVLAGVVVDTAAVAQAGSALEKITPAAGPATLPAVPEENAGGLPGMGTPGTDREELAPAKVKVYQPGSVVSFTVPDGWSWKGAQLVPTQQLERGLQGAVTQGAVAEAVEAVSASVEAPLPVSKTVVKGPAAGLTFAEPLLPGVVTWPVEASGTQNFAAQRAAAQGEIQQALQACSKLPATILPTATGEKLAEVKPGEGPAAEDKAVDKTAEKASEKKAEKKPDDKKGPDPAAPGQLAVGWSWQDYRHCESDPAVVKARQQLAMLELAHDHAAEALTVLTELPSMAVSSTTSETIAGMPEALPRDGASRWLTAVALSQRGAGAAAEKILNDTPWPAVWQPQVDLWRTAALQQQGRSGAALNAWPRQPGLLGDYPAPLRVALQQAVASAQVAVGEPKAAQQFVDQLADDFSGGTETKIAAAVSGSDVAGDTAWTSPVPPWLVRLQGDVRLGGAAENQGLEMLAQVAKQDRDPVAAARAKYDFVHALLRRGELSRPQAIAYLDELRLFWRGGELEKKMLGELADLYLADGDYRNALNSWQTLTKLSPDDPEMGAITDKMTNALLAAFDPDSGPDYSPLVFAGLYYDFKTLLPADARGDRATERVADLMGSIGLNDRALPLYKQLLQFSKITPVDQARIALKLAAGTRESGNPAEALAILDKYKPTINSQQKQEWKLEDARALMALQRYDSAGKTLEGADGPDAQALRGEIAWHQQDWSAVRKLMQPVLTAAIDSPTDGTSATVPVDALRLAYAEMMADKDGASAAPAVAKVVDHFRPVLEQDPLAGDVASAIAGEAGVSGSLPVAANRPLGQVAVTLRDMNTLASAATQKREEEVKARDEQQEYDSRMKYMELLPPPAI